MATRERRIHQGVSFDLWTGDQSWFWKLDDRGAIGAALSQPQAVLEACMAIDEFLGRDMDAACEVHRQRWCSVLDRLAEHVTTA